MSSKNKIAKYLEDYFELRRFERNGLAMVLLLGILFFFVRISVNHKNWDKPTDIQQFIEVTGVDRTTNPFHDVEMDSDVTFKLRPFNPNTANKNDLSEMGLPPSAVKSIINFRKAGFHYKKPEDLLKCYGVDQELFDQLAPFIVLVDQGKDLKSYKSKAIDEVKVKVYQPFLFNPNQVSRTDLVAMNLPTRFINGFLNYRNSGAQFDDIEDFSRIYVLTPELKDVLLPFLKFTEGDTQEEQTKDIVVSQPPIIQRFRFDPNKISQDSLVLLGVQKSVARTWVNFRNNGKVFYTLDDIKSIYGLNDSTLMNLSDLIDFPELREINTNINTSSNSSSNTNSNTNTNFKTSQPALLIDPNAATIEDLMDIKGIGRYYANQIIWNRKKLGGFYDIEQIGASENLPDSTFQAIRYHFIKPSLDSLRMINVNTTRRRAFADHPYISYDRVNRIITHREFVGRIESLDYLLKVGLLTPYEAQRLGPYLIFD